jgi:RNA polymerase sigma factor (sigma-70 family)
MNVNDTDLQLLARYVQKHAEDAFTEIVRRHLNLVFSAALRQVRSPELAQEVAQSVFIDLARQANRLAPDTILSAWLYQIARRTAIDVVRREVRRQHREQVASELTAVNAASTDWTQIEPFLDEAMHALDDTDRAAVLLRYFENKSFLQVGQALGTTDDAARKRVSRAVERLREFFASHGVTVAASGLVVLISANAVQAAPAGLAATISSAAVLAGTAVATTTTTAALTKAIAMTTLQKTLITVALVATVGTGIYEARQASTLRDQVRALQQQQVESVTHERDASTGQTATVRDEETANQLQLRAEVERLRQRTNELERAVQSLQGIGRQSAPAFPTNFVRTDSLKFVGYGTPEDTLQSTFWAKSTGNEKAWLAGIAAEEAYGASNYYVRGTTDQERSQFLIDQTKNFVGGRILSEIPVADDEVIVQQEAELQYNGATNSFVSMEVLKKIDGQWKLYDEYNDNGLFRKPQ